MLVEGGEGDQWAHGKLVEVIWIRSQLEAPGEDQGDVHQQLQPCLPMVLFIKDHKPAALDGLHKTRPIVCSQDGMEVHLQNLISDLVEPLTGEVEGGCEYASKKDFLYRVGEANKQLRKFQQEEGENEISSCLVVILKPVPQPR